ncbi:MAG TPA: hypothetical protein VLW48_00865, partial [Candidatus Bathyarchaeia archaeon]|nr:hypothetical protein [Candidatus Bathyarchaeia archaeon]
MSALPPLPCQTPFLAQGCSELFLRSVVGTRCSECVITITNKARMRLRRQRNHDDSNKSKRCSTLPMNRSGGHMAIQILTAAQAAAEFENGTLPPHVEVEDAGHNVARFLDVLEQIALAHRLTSIVLTDSVPFTISVAQLRGDAAALEKISGPYQFTVKDTAANVSGALSNLEAAAKAGLLHTITLSDGGILSLDVSQATKDLDALLKVAGSGHLAFDGTAAHISASLDSLQKLAGKITGIVIDGAAILTLKAAQIHDDAAALAKISGSYQVTVKDTAANVTAALASLEAFAKSGLLHGITLTDGGVLSLQAAQATTDLDALLKIAGAGHLAFAGTAAHVAENLDSLQQLAAKITTITIDGTALLTLKAVQVHNDAGALSKIGSSYQVTVKDTAANVTAALAYLEAAAKAGTLNAIDLTDHGTPSLSITAKQLTADGDALAKIAGPYSLNVSNVLAGQAISIASVSHVASIEVNDSAAHVLHYLAQLEGLVGGAGSVLPGGAASPSGGVLSDITLTDNSTPTISLSESDLSGAEGVLDLITSPFLLDVTDVLAADVGSLSANPLIDLLSVSDSAANIATYLSDLEAAGAAGK